MSVDDVTYVAAKLWWLVQIEANVHSTLVPCSSYSTLTGRRQREV